MSDLPTPVGGEHPERDVTIRYGRERLDAAGLFIQWLTEHVNDLVAGRATIRVELHVGYVGRVRITLAVLGAGFPMFKKTWEMEQLNALLEADNGRGELLKEEIRGVLAQIRERST